MAVTAAVAQRWRHLSEDMRCADPQFAPKRAQNRILKFNRYLDRNTAHDSLAPVSLRYTALTSAKETKGTGIGPLGMRGKQTNSVQTQSLLVLISAAILQKCLHSQSSNSVSGGCSCRPLWYNHDVLLTTGITNILHRHTSRRLRQAR